MRTGEEEEDFSYLVSSLDPDPASQGRKPREDTRARCELICQSLAMAGGGWGAHRSRIQEISPHRRVATSRRMNRAEQWGSPYPSAVSPSPRATLLCGGFRFCLGAGFFPVSNSILSQTEPHVLKDIPFSQQVPADLLPGAKG